MNCCHFSPLAENALSVSDGRIKEIRTLDSSYLTSEVREILIEVTEWHTFDRIDYCRILKYPIDFRG